MSALAPIPTRPRLTREDVLDGRDVAELLHLPISTVLEYARRGLLPLTSSDGAGSFCATRWRRQCAVLRLLGCEVAERSVVR